MKLVYCGENSKFTDNAFLKILIVILLVLQNQNIIKLATEMNAIQILIKKEKHVFKTINGVKALPPLHTATVDF